MRTRAKITKAKNKRYARRKHRANTIAKERSDLPRLIVNRSNSHISAQIVGRDGGVICQATDAGLTGTKKEKAFATGEKLAKVALKEKCENVVFDRNGYLYHGRVAQLAEGARAGGLQC